MGYLGRPHRLDQLHNRRTGAGLRCNDDLFHRAPSLLVIRSEVHAGKGHYMSKSVLYMSMSLDGYIAGANDQPSNPGGDDFMRLHEW
jgi:hypothetical protein